MFFWIDLSSVWSSILSIFGIGALACVAWWVLYIVWRAITDNLHGAQRQFVAPGEKNVPQDTPRGIFARTMIFFGTTLGGMWNWWLQSNNRRARIILVLLALSTIVWACTYLPYAYHKAQPNGLRDAVLTETFGQQPLSGRSLTRSAYIPDPDEFYGTAAPSISVQAQTRPATSILWLFFWMFVCFPFVWACAILYAVLSLREETWSGTRKMVEKVRDWISNMSEHGIHGVRHAGGTQGGLTFGAPLVMTAGGTAVTSEVAKPKVEVPWVKIMHWLKRNSGEIIAALFVIDEVLELGMARRGKKNKNKEVE